MVQSAKLRPWPRCLSRSSVARTRAVTLEVREVTGRKALRVQPVSGPIEIGSPMLWRVSSPEVVSDENNQWARSPRDLLDERLRDLLFGTGGFRSSVRAGDPVLDVRLVTFEGDIHSGSLASLELTLSLRTADQLEHRTRIVVRESLASASAEGLAVAMGKVLSLAADRTGAWVRKKL